MTHTDRSEPETKGVDVELASASVRPEPIDVAAWREAMGGVTPGPWYSKSVETEGTYGSGEDATEGFDSYVVRTEAQKHYGEDAVICDALNSGTAEVHEEFDEDGTHAWDEPGRRNMEWIARCSPEGISSLLNEIERLQALENQPVALADANKNARELAEAREEIERLRGSVECEECSGVGHTGIDGDEVYDCPACLGEGNLTLLRAAEYKLECLGAEFDHAVGTIEARNAELSDISAAIGSTRFMDPPDGGDVSLSDQVGRMRETLDAAEQRIATLEIALKPFVRPVRRSDHDDFPVNVTFTAGEIRRAGKALENGPAGLADANSKSLTLQRDEALEALRVERAKLADMFCTLERAAEEVRTEGIRADAAISSLRVEREKNEADAYELVAKWHERQAQLFRAMADDEPRTAKPARDRAREAATHHAASAAALRNRAADERRARSVLAQGDKTDAAS